MSFVVSSQFKVGFFMWWKKVGVGGGLGEGRLDGGYDILSGFAIASVINPVIDWSEIGACEKLATKFNPFLPLLISGLPTEMNYNSGAHVCTYIVHM